ncbi:RecQ family ATP-dependent DNA helicase [Ichthyobacterium seriolicida]|uniref:ATP-dependent DNA helicase RecQ n=1 Tax=Ichthyobacterium seriolicida TaxID=242600 RepID=A0A1J1E5J4_9FLAO|nr:RecQ family ATP-dependent DNA helicase [Ichthyobacterium seriolicida]BAV95316.1 ATP-dependent DNA helicase RecQ [Ichthyobacterium seriolicida]
MSSISNQNSINNDNTPLEVLKKYWAYDSFRPVQEDIINDILLGKDTLALLPTGGGKSICFQIPAIIREGVCIVISPLISLMKDQIDTLTKKGISAVAITSEYTNNEIHGLLQDAQNGNIKFIYLSPEKLSSKQFREYVSYMRVSLLAVDEAHCISQWGYDFRPSYLEIANIRSVIRSDVPVLALTASATPHVVDDIQKQLLFRKKNVIKKSFERKNLAYVVLSEEDKNHRLISILKKTSGTGIVYVKNRRRTKEISDFINSQSISSDFYHAGIDSKDKTEKQNSWKREEIRVIVSTNAFGMGIDKPNVRFVIHMDIPNSMEAYFQEAGRAGRDNEKSYCIMIVNSNDADQLEEMFYNTLPSFEVVRDTYIGLCNYLQIPKGEIIKDKLPFYIRDFCNKKDLNFIKVFNVLRLLHRERIIFFSEREKRQTKIMFNVDSDYIFEYLQVNTYLDNTVKTILRSYAGINSKFVNVDIGLLSERSGINIYDLNKNLERLSKDGIILYDKAHAIQTIKFLVPRQDGDTISTIRENIESNNKRNIDRLNSIIDYVSDNNICRSVQLLKYFGEKQVCKCCVCDVCLDKKRTGVDSKRYLSISDEIKSILNSKAHTSREIIDITKNRDKQELLECLTIMLESGVVKMNEYGEYELQS